MRSIFFVLVCLILSGCNIILAQTANQSMPATANPRVGITVFADGKPVNQQSRLKIDTKKIRFNALLDVKSASEFNDFEPNLLIKNVEVILARNSRQIARIDIENEEVPEELAASAQPEDRLLFKLTLVAQKKDGTTVSLPEEPVYTFMLRK